MEQKIRLIQKEIVFQLWKLIRFTVIDISQMIFTQSIWSNV